MSNGAQALMRTLVDAGVTVCFTNPGTSEMHFVAALDGAPEMRAVLCLFEGVATGAADGYARMAGKPAATLLHLGCGLGNGLANLHNARKGGCPWSTSSATTPPTTSSTTPNCSRTSRPSRATCRPGCAPRNHGGPVPRCRRGHRNVYGTPGAGGHADPAGRCVLGRRRRACGAAHDHAAAAQHRRRHRGDRARAAGRRQECTAAGRPRLARTGLMAAARVAARTGAKLFAEVFPTRSNAAPACRTSSASPTWPNWPRCNWRTWTTSSWSMPRRRCRSLPTPGKKSDLVPDTCTVHVLASATQDALGSLEGLVAHVGAADTRSALQAPLRPGRPRGKFTADKVCKAIGHLLPENAIIVDEAQTSGLMLPVLTAGAPRHDLLTLTGGAIGQGLPCAVGARSPARIGRCWRSSATARRCTRSRPCGRWRARSSTSSPSSSTTARTAILNVELQRVGAAAAGPKGQEPTRPRRPCARFRPDGPRAWAFPRCAQRRRRTSSLRSSTPSRTPGPHLIEAVVPSTISGLKLKLLPRVLGSLAGLPAPLGRAIKRKLAP